MSAPPLVARARDHGDRVALVGPERAHSYRELLDASAASAARLLAGADDLEERRVAFAVAPGFDYVAWQWGIWRAGGVAVPLSLAAPEPEIEYLIADADCAIVAGDPEREPRLRPLAGALGCRYLSTAARVPTESRALPPIDPARRAMIIYTSGTTSRPKGVVSTHAIIEAQIHCLVEAWEWEASDRIVNVLPLNHIHAIINVLGCALWAGARCELLARFEPARVWERFAGATLFMAVPTVYARLIRAWEEARSPVRRRWTAAAGGVRLMVSGSAALPRPMFERWREITGQVLLERYGMTEIGMALSNPLHGDRVPATVGVPLPGVEVRLIGEDGEPAGPGEAGEIQVRGPGVFREYWRRPEETAAAFHEGWFATGDVAVIENGRYRILGRASVDIIKTGGYKVSALEIETVLLGHPQVDECAVVGVPDPEWGERVAAVLVARAGRAPGIEDLQRWTRERLTGYKVPTRWLVIDNLPRNTLGKVTKPALVRLFQ